MAASSVLAVAVVLVPALAARIEAALLVVKVPEPSFAAEALAQVCVVGCFIWAGRSWLRRVK